MAERMILVTGGAGFVGSHLCRRLLQEGHTVVCLDNLSSGSRKNIADLSGKFTFEEGDANRREDLQRVFDRYPFDTVFHYAAVVGVKRTLEDPLSVLNDVEGIRQVLALSHEKKVNKVVFASSSEVYGEPVEIPEVETGHVNAKLPYAVVKMMGEKYMEAYHEQYGMNTTSLRFFNVYGPRQESSSYGFVVGIFIQQVLEGQSPTIFGDGTQTRDFVYIDDNIEAAIRAMESDKSAGEVINVGTGRPTTVLDLAEDIIALAGKSGELKPVFVETHRADIKHRFPDVTKMQQLLNFRPTHRLHEGLQKTLDWYNAQRKKQ